MRYQSLRGTHDILPKDTPKWRFLERSIHEIFSLNGFSEIITPIIEQTELFTKSIGEQTDIVSKEMYNFIDKGGRNITLRPEATAAVVRAAIEHNLIGKDKAAKFYYFGPMFRYERPQAGRFRQFYQAGVEYFGIESYFADADVILCAMMLFEKLGIKSLELQLNSVGCKKCRPDFEKKLRSHLEQNMENLCDDCKQRYQKNLLRIFDCKNSNCQKIYSLAPKIYDSICETCKSHFDGLITLLKSMGKRVSINNKLVRGLDYYTKTTFEIISDELGAQNSICGGGRYDNLVEMLGGQNVPAVGMAIGIERLITVMESQKLFPKIEKGIDVYFIILSDVAGEIAFKNAYRLRQIGKLVEIDFSSKALKTKLKNADIIGAKNVVILGEDEMKNGICTVKNMLKKEQKQIKLDQIFEELSKC